MFASWGRFVFHFRYAVIAVMVALIGAMGFYGFDISQGKHLSQGGVFDSGSESARGSALLDNTYGRDHGGDVVLLITAPTGKTVDDPALKKAVVAKLNSLPKQYPDQITKVDKSYWTTETTGGISQLRDKTRTHAFATIALKGNDDTTVMDNYQLVKNNFDIPGIKVEVAGLQPVTGAINNTMNEDVHRMELLAIPAVAILLFFVFGGVVAASLPLIVGGMTILGGSGVVRIFTNFTDVNAFVWPVVSMVGLGLAIDYGLFIVSRFREEIAEGYPKDVAIRRTISTAGRTVVMSATMIVASCAGLLLFPQTFVKSLAYGAMSSVSLAAICAITVLPAILGILGHRVDALGVKWIRKTKTSDEIEAGVWGRLTRFVMQHPLKIAVPIVIGLSLLIIPVKNLAFGGITPSLLPPDDPTRLAQQHFDEHFAQFRQDPILVIIHTQNSEVLSGIETEIDNAPGLLGTFHDNTVTKDGVYKYEAVMKDPDHPKETIKYLRSISVPDGVDVMVAGTPALQQDSLDSLIGKLPLMVLVSVTITTLLMFLTFGSLVLPIKAALMSALGLGSTLGILTWIFIDGHGSGLLNFTPGPIMAPVLVLIIALIFGLSTDYEVFLLSRMVEARAMGASTTEAVRVGMAHTSRIITAAALILIVVTGAFGFSHLVMMQYIACGMVAALIIDATLLRMFLVPATMKMLGDDCWWAPRWMKKVQEKIGFGEPMLADERLPADLRILASADPKSDRPEDARTMIIPVLDTGAIRMHEAGMADYARSITPQAPRRQAPPAGSQPPAPRRPMTRPAGENQAGGAHASPAQPPRPRPPLDPPHDDHGRHAPNSGESLSVSDLLKREEQ